MLSIDAQPALGGNIAPAYRSVGRSLDDATGTQFEVDMLVAGDLVGKV